MAKPTLAAFSISDSDWNTLSGPAGDKLFVAFADYENERHTLLRDEKGTTLIYDRNEWLSFIDGVKRGEFD